MPFDDAHTFPPLLFVGDMHIGRRPESLAPTLEPLGIATRTLAPASAWMRTVRHAIDRQVRAVVLAGDVVDRARDLLEAYGVVERGARELQSAGIPLIAVAGNHDALLLPRLDEHFENVRLLGAGGRWERHTIGASGVDDDAVDLFGWSFPAAHHDEDPLEDPGLAELLAVPRSRPRILVVHGDLDASTSRYAPMRRATLQQLPIDAAFLGHLHTPDPFDGDRPCGYLGSLVGLDGGETGAHGPVEVAVDSRGGVAAERVPLAPLRWDAMDVDVTSSQPWSEEALWRQIQNSARRWCGAELGGAGPGGAGPDVVALRVRLTGRRPTRGWQEAVHALERGQIPSLFVEEFGGDVVIERCIDNSRPAIELEALAAEHTPVGALARILLGPLDDTLLQQAQERWELAWHDENLAAVPEKDFEDRVRSAAWRLLERMSVARADAGDEA